MKPHGFPQTIGRPLGLARVLRFAFWAAGVVGPLYLSGLIASPSAATTQEATFTPVADAHVSENAPAKNYGGRRSVRTDAVPINNTYLRFDVQGVGTVTSATLRMFAETDNSVGFDVRTVSDNTWGESAINYGNAPPFGAVVGSSGPVTGGNWYSIDVSVSGDGPVSFALTSNSSRATRYSSREGTNPPQLIIDGGP